MDEYVDWSKMNEVAERLCVRGYEMKHLNVCKAIWLELVPQSGQADNLQGELLRQVEKLRHEATCNGNRNWDDCFAWFCDHLEERLTGSGLFDEERCRKITGILGYIKENGEYARSYIDGRITDDECDPVKLAYVDDDIYDYLCDAVAEFYLSNKKPVPYEKKEFIYR